MSDELPLPSEEELERELARRCFWDFFRYLDPRTLAARWQEHAAGELQEFYEAWRRGERPRLLLLAPPQHGKTRLVTDFLAWVLGKLPDAALVYASFSQTLGERANARLQRALASPRYRAVFPDVRLPEGDSRAPGAKRRNLSLVELEGSEGGFRNTTVRGRINGEGFWLGVLDDPLKGREEAESKLVRDRTWDWLHDDFFTRLADDGAFLGIGTRWHLADPLGRLAAEDRARPLAYRALAEADDPLGREPGAPLFPEFKSLRFLEEQRSGMHPSSWLSLYQQRPVPREGGIVKTEWLSHRYVERGEDARRVLLSIDAASKAKDRNDPTGALVLAEFADLYELWYVEARRLEFPELKRWVRDLAAAWRPTHVLVEDKDAGQQLVQELRREARLPVVPFLPRSDKETRLMEVSGPIAAGRVLLPDDAPWVASFVEELTTFPQSAHDDRVDALSQALRWSLDHEPLSVDGLVPGGTTRPSPRLASAADEPRQEGPRTPKVPKGVGGPSTLGLKPPR